MLYTKVVALSKILMRNEFVMLHLLRVPMVHTSHSNLSNYDRMAAPESALSLRSSESAQVASDLE